MKFFITLSFVCFSFVLLAQGLKPLDYTDLLSDAGVWKETQYRINFKDEKPTDTCLQRVNEYDLNGRLISRTDHFACGRVYSVERFSYNENGKLIENTIGHVFNQFEAVPFVLSYDNSDRVIERRLEEPIRNFWISESFIYDDHGTLTAIEQASLRKGEKVITNREKYACGPIPRHPKNTLSQVFDENGLPLLDNVFQKEGLHHAIRYYYEFRPEGRK